MHTRLVYTGIIVYCTVHKFICTSMCVGALSKGLRNALPISEKPKLAWLEFQYIDIILKLAWLEFQYFDIQKITENNFSISVYRYSNIDIPNPGYN